MDCQLETMIKCKHNNRTFQSSRILSIIQKSVGFFYFRIPCLPIIPFHESKSKKKNDLNIFLSAVKCSTNVALIQLLVEKFIIIFAFVMLSTVDCQLSVLEIKIKTAQVPHTYKPYSRCHTNIRFQIFFFFFCPYFIYLLILDQMLMQLKVDKCLRSKDLKDFWFSASNKRDKNETKHEFLWPN